VGERSYFVHVENANASSEVFEPSRDAFSESILAIPLIDLTYLAVLFNFTSLYPNIVQTALGVAQWESQPTARVTLGGSRRTVSVRAWKQSGDVPRLLVAGRRGVSS
jgi:hypothetical protein